MTAKPRWRELQDLFDHLPVSEAEKQRLFDEMGRPGRLYHGRKHLEILWRRHNLYKAEAGLDSSQVDLWLASAIAFHDSVYDTLRSDNEDRSAEVWLRASAGAPLSEIDRRWVARTIRATKDHLGYRESASAKTPKAKLREQARLWMLDLDLTPFGEKPEVFEENAQRLRAEFSHIGDTQWKEGQREFLRRFLDAPRIFRTPALASRFDAAARRNLAAAAKHKA